MTPSPDSTDDTPAEQAADSPEVRRIRLLLEKTQRLAEVRDRLQSELRQAKQDRTLARQETVAAQRQVERMQAAAERQQASLERLQADNAALRAERARLQAAVRAGRDAHRLLDAEARGLRSALRDATPAVQLTSTVARGGAWVEACVAYAREQVKRSERHEARAFSHALMREPSTQAVGALCAGLHAHADGFLPLARQLFAQSQPAWVDRWAAAECLDAEFDHAEADGRRWYEAWVLRLQATHGGAMWPGLAEVGATLLGRQAFDLAGQVAQRLQASGAEVPAATAHWMTRLAEREHARAIAPAAPEPGTVRLALIDYKMLELRRGSANLGDHVQTLASLSNLLRFSGARLRSEVPGLAERAQALRERLAPAWQLPSPAVDVELSLVDRDFSSAHAGAGPTWMLAFGWYMHPNFEHFFDFPFAEHLCPIFLSFHVNDREMLSERAVAYLQRWAPIGCRDWTSVYLLRERGVDAFFSGCLTTTIGKFFEGPAPESPELRDRLALVDYRDRIGEFDEARVDSLSQATEEVRARDFLANLDEAVQLLERYRSYERIVTSRLHCYLPCRSIGLPVEFRPRNRADVRFEGLLDLSDSEFAAMRVRIEQRIADIMSRVLAGDDVATVQAAWRELCREDVAAADAYCRHDLQLATSNFDAGRAAEALRQGAAHLGQRFASGEAMQLAFAVDHHLAEELPVVLESVLAHTPGPLHVHVMTRGLPAAYWQRLGREFGHALQLSCYDFDQVDYGDSLKMLAHTTVSTMDRLLLPDLLAQDDKVIYLDVDILVQGDLAELWALPLGPHTLAGKSSTDALWRTGHHMVYRAARGLSPERAAQLRRAMHAAGSLDFPAFNAGVVVMNLARMRQDGFASLAIPLIAHYGMNDQDALNVYARGDRLELPIAWNAMPSRDVTEGAKLLHFAGPIKPWSELYILRAERFAAMRQAYLDRVGALA